MTDFLQNFESYLKLNKKASANTISSYVRDTSKFIFFLKSNNYTIFEISDEKTILDYISYIQKEGKSVATTNRTISALKVFYCFLISTGNIASNPAAKIKSFKQKKDLPRILTVEEVDIFLSQPDSDSLKGCRDKAMLELLYATGIRVSELTSLNMKDIDTSLEFLYCKQRNSERIIPLHPTAISTTDNYIKKVRPLLINSPTEEALFVNLNGTRMTRQGFWKIIKHYQQSAGIETEITPQTLRHSFATHLLENGANLDAVKELLGHSDISSTHIYAKLIKKKSKNSYIKFHPRA